MTMRHTCYERVCYTAHRCDNHKSLRFFFPLCMRTQERMQCCYCRNESLTLGDTGFFKSHISIEMRLTAGAECRKLPRRNASIVSATARHLQSMVLEMFFSSMVNCLCEVWKVFQNDFVKPDELDKVTTSHVVCCRGLEQPIFLGQTFGQGFLRGVDALDTLDCLRLGLLGSAVRDARFCCSLACCHGLGRVCPYNGARSHYSAG